jgi:hypothetical protein
VKQRLSRGRAMLQEQVTAFVEGALRRSGPGRAFTLAVVAALPAFTASATAATVGATALKGSTLAEAAAATGMAGAILGPLLGILGGYVGARASIQNTKSPRERRFMVHLAWITAGLALLFTAALLGLIVLAKPLIRSHPGTYALLLVGVLMGYTIGLVALILWSNRRQRMIQHEETMKVPPVPTRSPAANLQPQVFEYRSAATLLGLPLVHIRFGRRAGTKPEWVRAWIAVGDRACGILFALGGLAVGGGAVGYLAVGGAALGWKGALGGLAIAHEYAQGGMAVAQHGGDETARAYFQNHPLLSRTVAFMKSLSSPWALPIILIVSLVPTFGTVLLQRRLGRRVPPLDRRPDRP